MLQPRTGIAANKRLAESPDGARCRSGPVATGMRGPNKQGGARRLQRRLGQRSLALLSAAAKSRNADLGLSAGTLPRSACFQTVLMSDLRLLSMWNPYF